MIRRQHAWCYQPNYVALDINSCRQRLSVQDKNVILKRTFFFRNEAVKGSDVHTVNVISIIVFSYDTIDAIFPYLIFP